MKPLLLACALALATGKPTSRPRHESTAALVAGGDAKPTLAHGQALEAKLRELERTVDVPVAKHDASVEGGAKTGAAKTGATAHDKASAHVTPVNAERRRRRSRTVTEGEVAATVNSTLDSLLVRKINLLYAMNGGGGEGANNPPRGSPGTCDSWSSDNCPSIFDVAIVMPEVGGFHDIGHRDSGSALFTSPLFPEGSDPTGDNRVGRFNVLGIAEPTTFCKTVTDPVLHEHYEECNCGLDPANLASIWPPGAGAVATATST